MTEERAGEAEGELTAGSHGGDAPEPGDAPRRTDRSTEDVADAPDDQPAGGSRRPDRSGRAAAWTLAAVVAVVGVLIFAELVRISGSLNKTACVTRAQAAYQTGIGTGITAQQASLGRLSLRLALARCDR